MVFMRNFTETLENKGAPVIVVAEYICYQKYFLEFGSIIFGHTDDVYT